MTGQMTVGTSFAVVITNYNYREYVVEAVTSVLDQTRSAQQVIVVDDGSRDDSVHLLRAAFDQDPRVTLLCGENGGQLAAFQRGMAMVQSDVVCFLDADDRWGRDYLAKLGQVFDQRNDIDFVFSDVTLFGNDTRTIAFEKHAVDLGYTAIITCLKAFWYGAPTSALALRAPMARRCLDLPDHMTATWRICADSVLVLGTSVLCGRKYFLPTGSVGYRIHGKNGWGLSQPPGPAFLNALRSRQLVAHFATQTGLNASCWSLLKREFKTKPRPTQAETRRYARLAMAGNGSYLARLQLSLSIRRWAWRKRRAVDAQA